MQEFYIKKGATLPCLRMELINDGRHDFHRSMLYNNGIQAADVTFSMKDTETGILKVSKGPVDILLADDNTCEEKYILQYQWTERDTKKEGIYEGWFDIDLYGLPKEEGVIYPDGHLKMPIEDPLIIYVK